MFLKHKFLLLLIVLSISACNDSEDSASDSSSGFTLSGHISVANNTATDNDINDSRAPTSPSNNSIQTAQRIANPIILGGYVNQPNAGPSGYSKRTGDIDDFFAVELRAGQIIYLFVANDDLEQNDLDLFLLDSSGSIVNSSIGDQDTEGLLVNLSGHYFIQVRAYLGASNYVLSIGQNLTFALTNTMRLSDSFMPGEVIVQFSPEYSYQTQNVINNLGLHTQSQDVSRRQLFHFDPEQSLLLAAPTMRFAYPELAAKYETLLRVKQLRQRHDVLEASPNYQLHLFAKPNDELYPHQWNHTVMNLPQAWDMTIGDASVTVAILDSGALLNHPDLQSNLIAGYDFVNSTRIALDGDGIDPNPADPGDQMPGGSSFHGTHVAGTVAAITNNQQGVAGIGWLTKVMPIRVVGKGGVGFDYDIEQAIRFAAGLPNDSGTIPSQPADVINLSLGGPNLSLGFQQVITQARQASVIIVAAAGNENTDTPFYPAALAGVVSVGAIDINKQRASYSNFGQSLDVVAPGGDYTPDVNGDGVPDGILSTVGYELDKEAGKQQIKYTFDSSIGTSMATPHIAGVISLMKAVHPDLTPQEFDDLLTRGTITDDLGTPGRDDQFGYGLINARKAVLAAIELNDGVVPEPPPPVLVVNPNSLNFGLDRTSIILTLNNGGSGELQIENIVEDSGGVLTIEGSGLGEYIIRLNRSQLPTGTFTATITLSTNANTVKIPVIWQVGDPHATGNAGFHYILLVDPNTSETIEELSTSATKGVYHFKFENISPGTYIVVAGTDFDNNGFICDVGEACGAFLTLGRPTPLEVTDHRSDVNFSTGFNVNFFSKNITASEISVPSQGFARLHTQHTFTTINF